MMEQVRDQQALKARLIEERARLLDQASHAGAGIESEREPDTADGSATLEQERVLAVTAELRATLEEVNRALEKIEQGTYGRCDSCGKAIPAERLEILPQASLCVSCKSNPRRS